jgi:phage terminase large subunit GpA-like protein
MMAAPARVMPELAARQAFRHANDLEFLRERCARLTIETRELLPSEWSEAKRYLPASATSLPGYYRFDVAPYMREIIDCMSPESQVRHVTIMKGVQVGATTLIENTIGYYIDQVKTAPMMLVTADAELAKLRMESFVVPMLQHAGLDHLVRSNDETNPRKTGRTDKKYEWEGGGSLVPFGAVNANKLRSMPIQVLMRDEIDGWPDNVGKDGDPVQLSEDRTAAFESTRKIFDCSTPLIKGQSKIEKLFQQGDQRHFFVRCLSPECRHPQVLRWTRTDKETGRVSGFVWETEDGRLVEGSTRYLCEKCGHAHTNNDKPRLFAADNAEWQPTATAGSATHRSYHLSALYSPLGMQSWDACAQKWLEAWDVAANRSRDNLKLQVFYNNVLGEAFEVRGVKLHFETVSAHRRHAYRFGEVPNRWLLEHCGSPVLLITCAVDVHLDNLAVAIFGWCRERRVALLDYWRFRGNTEELDNPSTWGMLREVIEASEYRGDDGRAYRIQLTLIDCGYLTDTVYRFCDRYELGVFPVRGRESPPKSAPMKEFWSYAIEHTGMIGWAASVDMYKDRWSASLRRSWDGLGRQPEGYFNAPLNATDEQLKELTVETRREKIEAGTGKRLGFVWHRPSGADNELWDLLIYNNVALDIAAFSVCIQQMGLEQIDWDLFWSTFQ